MIELRDLEPTDSDRLWTWRRDPEVDRYMSGPAPTDPARHARWFQQLNDDDDRRGWIIVRNDRPCGLMTLTGLAGPHRRAEWGWYVGEAADRGRGVGRAAQALGLDIAFDEHGLEKVTAEVMADNDAALKSQAAAGFRREGYLPAHVCKGGQRRDVVLLGVLAAEWRALRGKLITDLRASGLVAA